PLIGAPAAGFRTRFSRRVRPGTATGPECPLSECRRRGGAFSAARKCPQTVRFFRHALAGANFRNHRTRKRLRRKYTCRTRKKYDTTPFISNPLLSVVRSRRILEMG